MMAAFHDVPIDSGKFSELSRTWSGNNRFSIKEPSEMENSCPTPNRVLC
jgi:hypothetical protein